MLNPLNMLNCFWLAPGAPADGSAAGKAWGGGFARVTAVAAIALAVWLYLLLARGGFWRCSERDDWPATELATWPAVAAVVPARNEADCIGASIASLLAQEYRGQWTIILVDDDSSDGTGDIARCAAGSDPRLHVLTSRGLPAGWTGKLWAVKQGLDAAAALPQPPRYVLLTDADIVHSPDSVIRLVAHAEHNALVLTSLMVKLACESFAERLAVPAFIFFFQMLYPFSWVNRRQSAVAAAAGGCMLVRPDVVRQAGGIEAVRGALIDDCALANLLKRRGHRIWIGLSHSVASTRRYARLADFWSMVSRSAFTQLRYSTALLIGVTLAMALLFAAPLAALATGPTPAALGAAALGALGAAYLPILRFYRLSAIWAVTLPVAAGLFVAMTWTSAVRYWSGTRATWKNRSYGTAR
jgi:hopene-associated glycosyltransferase HpnB